MLKGEFRKQQIEEEPKPRRYEIVNAETGEPVQGVSFILTPTGEEMTLLTKKGMWIGPMKDIGLYYTGDENLHPERDRL